METRKGYYDFEALKKNVPIIDVVSFYTGEQVSWNKKIHCPDINHEDKTPSASCYEKHNTCTCFSCLGKFNNLDIVKMHYGLDNYYEAASRMVEDMGLHEYATYLDKKTELKERNPITEAVLKKIGLGKDEGEEDRVKKFFDGVFDETAYNLMFRHKSSINDLRKDNPLCYYELILPRLERQIETEIEDYKSSVDRHNSVLMSYNDDDLIQIMQITADYKEFRQKEVDRAYYEYTVDTAKQMEGGEVKKKPPFKRPQTAFDFNGRKPDVLAGLMIEKSAEENKTKKESIENLKNILKKAEAEYERISPKVHQKYSWRSSDIFEVYNTVSEKTLPTALNKAEAKTEIEAEIEAEIETKPEAKPEGNKGEGCDTLRENSEMPSGNQIEGKMGALAKESTRPKRRIKISFERLY